MSSDATYDIVIYGATGFTGQLIAEYLAGRAGNAGVSWAIAGRNEAKLDELKAELGIDNLGVIVADAADADAVTAMAEQTGLIISAAGPYILYGEQVVAACARSGTDYVDLCGEANFIRLMADRYGAEAEANGARILSSCGFDSLPSDLGVFLLQSHAIEQTGQPLTDVKGRVVAFQGEVSGGTVASIGASMASAAENPEEGAYLADPFSLAPGFAGPEQPDARSPLFDEDFDSWASAFIMASINTQNVHRTNFGLGHRYGEDFRYSEMLLTGPGEKGQAVAESLGRTGGIDMSGELPKPGEGPSKEAQQAGHFTVKFMGTTESGDRLGTTVEGFLDPGYGCTSQMITETALELRSNTATAGGMWSPAAALGQGLIDRMNDTGVLAITID